MIPKDNKMKILSIICVQSIFEICLSAICLADISTIQLKPQLKEIKVVKGLKVSVPVLSPDNKKIAFVNFAPSKIPTFKEPFPHPAEGILCIFNINENKIEKLTNKVVLDDEPYVSWSPNSNSVAFGSKGEIWIVDVKTKKNIQIQKPNKKRIKAYPGYYENYFHSPVWFPNGEIIAMRNVNDIWLYNRLSKLYEKIYSPPEELKGKTNIWSLPQIVPSNISGKLAVDQLKFALPPSREKEQLIEGIIVIETKKRGAKAITGIKENIEYSPTFSHSDNFVAFFSRKDWDSKPIIFIYDLKSDRSIRATECEDECHMLSWSEDGSRLYFGTNKALWIVNLKTIANPTIEKKIFIKGIDDLSDVFWFPKGDTLFFLKPVESGKYLFGFLKL
jgi:WD40 repeat protein